MKEIVILILFTIKKATNFPFSKKKLIYYSFKLLF